MELLKVTKSGSLHFKLSDGRIGVSYSSGYVRVSTFSNGFNNRFYQINKQTFTDPEDHVRGYSFVKRELIPLQRDRINFLFRFNNKNCR